jgi:hypothetical protein
MKKVIRIVAVTLLFAAWGTTPLFTPPGPVPVPLCYPKPCSVT